MGQHHRSRSEMEDDGGFSKKKILKRRRDTQDSELTEKFNFNVKGDMSTQFASKLVLISKYDQRGNIAERPGNKFTVGGVIKILQQLMSEEYFANVETHQSLL